MPQLSYDTSMEIGIVGNRADGKHFESEAKQFHEQIGTWTLTFGGTATAGDYVFEVGGHRFTITRVSQTNAQLGDAGNAALSTSLALSSRVSVSDGNDGIVTIVALFPGDDLDVTAISAPSPGTLVAAVVTSPDAGSLEVGLGVCHGTAADAVRVPGSSDDAADFAGILMLGEEFAESVNGESAPAYQPGSVLEVCVKGSTWVAPEEAITSLSQPVYMRIEASGEQKLGAFRASASGSAQTSTVIPVVNHPQYGFEFDYLGKHYSAIYLPTDATTAIADAIAGLLDAIGTIAGLTITDQTTELRIVAAAGTAIENLRANVWDNDTEAASVAVTQGTADADAILIPGAKWKTLGAADTPVKLCLA